MEINENAVEQQVQAEMPSEAQIKAITQPAVEITDRQKEDFYKAFIADKPYQEEFALMNGAFVVRFKTLLVEENNAILEQIAYDQQQGLAKNNDAYFMQIVRYRLAVCLLSINNTPFSPDVNPATVKADPQTATTYISERAKLLNKWNVYKLAALQERYSEFERRVVKLTEEIANADFWKAAV